tara:strand:- start:1147 stop:2148 length:1002 start_codon:yes stop_codon:yes gene_type:complete
MTIQGPVLVTGGAGYIGSHTVFALRARGIDVVVLDNLSTGAKRLIEPGAVFVEGDAGNAALIEDILHRHKCTAVIHFAGSIINPESFQVPLDYYHNNVSVSRTLIDVCIKNGIQNFIFSSSAAVYGAPSCSPVDETTPPAPISPYGRSKLMTEWMLGDAAAASDLRYAALRYFNVAGSDADGRAGQIGPATHLIKIAAEAAVGTRNGMTIYGDDYDTPDGTCIRDYVHVSDLAEAHVLGLEYLRRGGASVAMNCSYGHGFSVHEVLAAVERVIGTSLQAKVGPRRIGDPPVLVGDGSRVVRDWGWAPKFDNLDVMIEGALAWERSLREGEKTV